MADTGIHIPRSVEPYLVRADGVKLYKYATDNGMKVIQHPSEQRYDEAIDVESAPWTYTASDEPIESFTDDDTQQKAKEFDYLTGQDSNIKNKVLNIYADIEDWKNPKDSENPYNKSDKCYYKEQFWVSTIDNNISEPGSLTNTWINI